eukprot:jgi/Phyca11/102996/e_gw1.7.272.1
MKKTSLSKQDSIRYLQTLIALLMTVGVFSVAWEVIALHTQRSSFIAAFDALSPHVSSDDLLHLNYLETGCRIENNTVLPWIYAFPGHEVDLPKPRAQTSTSILHRGDPRLVDELRQCPEVDIYLPSSARGPAGCSTVVGALKFLQSRLLPDWVFEVELYDIVSKQKTNYFNLCPDTPMLFLTPEHVLTLTEHPSWPTTKPVYLMAPGLPVNSTPSPPPDQYTTSVLARTDVILCRTKHCDDALKQFLERDHSLVKKPRVIYTAHVSPDPTNYVQRLGTRQERNKTDVSSPRFAHTSWDFKSQTTRDVISCWKSQAKDLPGALDVYVLKKFRGKKPAEGERLYKQFPAIENAKTQTLDPLKFATKFTNTSFFICPTATDDCLDLARASGGVIVTADAYPMNELISGPSEGILFAAEQALAASGDSLLLPAPVTSYHRSDLCDAIRKARTLTSLTDRLSLGTQARHHFNEDATFFLRRMLEIRALARQED